MHMASCILSLELHYKWMLTATTLVHGIQDLRCILRFLQSSSWLTLQMPPDTFEYTLNIDDDWIADGSNVPGTGRLAVFMPVADPYKEGPEFGLLVHCTTMVWDPYMLPIIGEVGKSRKAAQTSDILIRQHHYEETIGKRAFAVLCTLMLRRTMVSHIPFKNPRPIINIPPIYVTTELLTFTKSSGAGQFYINLVDSRYKRLREEITRVTSVQATTMGKTKPFGPLLAVCSPFLHSAYSWPGLNGSGNILVETIMDITFRGRYNGQTEPDHAEDGYFWVCKGFPREHGPNTSP